MQKTLIFLKPVVALLFIAAVTGCNKEQVYVPTPSKTAEIYDFWLEKTQSNTKLNRDYEGMIAGDSIRLTVDYGTDITSLEPTIFADADSIAPKGKQNFTAPVKYTIWANGKSASYTVHMTVSPVQFPKIKAIASGYAHIMALKTDGTVWVCGNNSSSQLGVGDYSGRNTFTQVPVYDVDQVFTGDAASIIRLKDGTTWGAGNQYGQLGLGNVNSKVTFTRVPFLDDAAQIAITFNEVFALKTDGTVWGAGRNWGQILQQGDNDLRATFVKIPVANVKQIYGCALDIIVQKNNGELWGWGDNTGGELGVGDNLPRRTPTLIPTSSIGAIAKIFVGGVNTFLIDNSGNVWATGANARGELGLGDQKVHNSFTQVSFASSKSIDVIVPHSGSTTFKETNGNVWNVGDNVYGAMGLGNATTLPNLTPVQLTGFTVNTAAGRGGTVYILNTDGTLWAWGSNLSGALGTGTDIMYSATPIQIK
jgi:alpha-tubulin suppressor-like RCC1 family protein